MQRDVSYSQLTIDGRAVSHPPPKPRIRCRDCDKYVTLTTEGYYHHHKDGWGNVCPAVGKRPER